MTMHHTMNHVTKFVLRIRDPSHAHIEFVSINVEFFDATFRNPQFSQPCSAR